MYINILLYSYTNKTPSLQQQTLFEDIHNHLISVDEYQHTHINVGDKF